MKGNQGTARAINRRWVLQHLRAEPGLSRADLAARIGLSRAAITSVVADMIEERLLIEGEANKGAPGRRPIPLEIDYSSRCAVGIRVCLREIECVLTDLSTEVLEVVREPLTSMRPQAIVEAAHQAMERLETLAHARGARITGVGVGVPGAVQVETGKVLRSFRFGFRNIPLARMISERVNVPVWLDDDMHAYALNQQLFGAGSTHSTIAVVAIGEGIGCASIVDGKVRRGAHGAAGKIGHIMHDPTGPECECGRRGCLQAHYALPALEQRWQAGDGEGRGESLATAAKEGNPQATALLAEAGTEIGRVVGTFCNIIDPSALIIGGEATMLGEAFLDPLRNSVDQHILSGRCEAIIDWNDQSWARGAAALATQNLFDFESVGGAFGGKLPAEGEHRSNASVFPE